MERLFNNKYKDHFDIIVVGGGITGTCLAYEAVTRGYSVALFEKEDFGHATSSATSKMIHGGLRYLKNMEFGLVRDSLKERRFWENIAPNLVYPIPIMIPTYDDAKSKRALLAMGMILYDLLSLDKGFTWDKTKKLPLHKTITREETLEIEQCINTEGLTGSNIYYDCQNYNPDRLTLAVLRSAMVNGALAANYAAVKSFLRNGNTIMGAEVLDRISGQTHRFTAKIIVNCTGPWADIVLRNAIGNEEHDHRIRRSEGIHIIISKICREHAVVMITSSGRHIMCIPWRGHSIIGTTDKEYFGNPDDYRVTKQSVLELIEEVNENFGCSKIGLEDVKFAYGGLRPLVDDETEGSYESSRKYEIVDNAEEGLNNLITIEGGKYTTSRKLACDAMKLVAGKLGREKGKSVTNKQHLDGCRITENEEFRSQLQNFYPDFSPETVDYMAINYGLHAHRVLQLALKRPELQQVVTHDGEILAEVVYAIENEMALTLNDILFRRTGIGTLGFPGEEVMRLVARTAADCLNWKAKKTRSEMNHAMDVFRLTD